MEKGSVQSLDRAFQLLELLCKSPKGMTIQQLSQITSLHKSTVHRLLNSMAERGYVRRTGDAIYRAGMRICELGEYVQENLDVVSLAQGPMERLSRRTEETVHLVERDNDEIVYIYKVESIHQAIRMVSRIGMRRPLYCTAIGKAMLAEDTDDAICQYWDHLTPQAYTDQTIVRKDAFLREIQKIRHQGFAMDNEENELGVRCIAAAIADWRSRVCYALSISAPMSRMSDSRVEELIPLLLQTREEIAFCLGTTPTEE